MMFADDIVGLYCGGREVHITEYLDTWGKITKRDTLMRISRLKLSLWISLSNIAHKETEIP